MKKRMLVLAGLFSFSSAVLASEAEVKKQSAIEPVKVAKRVDSSQFRLLKDSNIRVERRTVTKSDEKSISSQTSREKAKRTKVFRETSPKSSAKAMDFSIYDAWISLDNDFDGDGYYSDFTVSFDADVSQGSATVYAEIYISQNGGDWEFLTDTQDFVITGQEEDEYSVSLSLLNDFPTDQYDILIDLFESGFAGIVATAEPADDGDLYALPLEDAGYDGNTLITYDASSLSSDLDLDGFYTKLSLEYDLETVDSGRAVYMEIDLINPVSGSRRQVTSLDFTLGNQTEFVDLYFESGTIDDWYDVEIRVLDYYTHEEITYAAYDGFSSLRALPIESEEFDYVADVDIVVVHDGGGSLGFMLIALLGLGAWRARKN